MKTQIVQYEVLPLPEINIEELIFEGFQEFVVNTIVDKPILIEKDILVKYGLRNLLNKIQSLQILSEGFTVYASERGLSIEEFENCIVINHEDILDLKYYNL
jgi:hypothetical protein